MTGNTDGGQRWQSSMMDNYGTPKLTLVSGSGCEVTDADGRTYLDLVSGIAVNALGHCHPAVVQAIGDQAARLGHVSNFYAHDGGLRLAEELLDLAGLTGQGRVLFCNSGAEANETAFKISRLTGRTKVVATDGGFHGRTMGALALTGQPAKRAPFEPMPAGVEHVPYGDVAALESAVDDTTAAVFLEPIQGENGVIVPPEGYLQAAREITSRNGALLVVDEVQTGIGRTGSWFAFQRAGILPDVITLAKGLGGGLPIGACIGVGAVGDQLRPGMHGTTFGGSPIACAAALAVLRTIASEGLLEHVDRMGKNLTAGIQALGHPLVGEVRGAGLLIGVGLTSPVAADVAARALEAGYLINPVQPDALRLCPPLVIQPQQVQRLLADLPALLEVTK
ncbi:acetylornithine aminotransferase [Saccharopolyspora erythraea NRRL 2338]|uniref:Acetylornithine aminotransferase n=2 Tax=Saccharopolyspora erythraea TaxID=1836 RepID=A4FKC4_SACEN|nr:acetylornithine transaminase [Saccharopolyspora erythraea]EQD81622.1 acetylornithine aminotransferase [Saccharopolyspora erythraea D]PFG98139.1 acetylornithine aminotransferase [Saccharopolyspora erythraea NRRL 2338]QRK88242.1 acetylornithine transaminase [Saccharopolyspora erythraea]CAM04499.1 acetylornithine aminotransferase [Saccharopolyspora erythraea NRRL 2338]